MKTLRRSHRAFERRSIGILRRVVVVEEIGRAQIRRQVLLRNLEAHLQAHLRRIFMEQKMAPKSVSMRMPNTLDREEQLQRLRERYARRNKQGKSRMLDELCEQYGYDRKHAVKLLGDKLS